MKHVKVTEVFKPDETTDSGLPLAETNVSAGFPSPADDFIQSSLDLNEHLVQHPTATFFVRVSGDSMVGAGIHNNDILVVDRSLEPAEGKVVIAVVDGEMVVKRFVRRGEEYYLIAENPDYPPLKIDEESDFTVWGVVTSVVHAL